MQDDISIFGQYLVQEIFVTLKIKIMIEEKSCLIFALGTIIFYFSSLCCAGFFLGGGGRGGGAEIPPLNPKY